MWQHEQLTAGRAAARLADHPIRVLDSDTPPAGILGRHFRRQTRRRDSASATRKDGEEVLLGNVPVRQPLPRKARGGGGGGGGGGCQIHSVSKMEEDYAIKPRKMSSMDKSVQPVTRAAEPRACGEMLLLFHLHQGKKYENCCFLSIECCAFPTISMIVISPSDQLPGVGWDKTTASMA